MKYINSNQKLNKNRILAMVILIFVLGLSITTLEIFNVINFFEKDPKQTEVSNSNNDTSYSPPSDEEKKAGDEQKKIIIEEDNASKNPSDVAEVVIVDAAQYDDFVEIRAFAANVLESGTCTFTLSKDGMPDVIKETAAYPDASSTPCITVTIPRNEFGSAGEWNLNAGFKSASTEGSKVQGVIIK